MRPLTFLFQVAAIIIISATFFIPAFASDYLPSGINTEELEEAVDSFVEQYIGTEVPGAAVAIVKDGEISLLKGYGYADLEKQIKIDPEQTVFEYGSVNKLFVWISAMQLKERGVLDLDENIETYLPDEITDELSFEEPITMADLMNHMAGFEDPMFYFAETDSADVISLREALIDYEPEQIFEPGEVIAYSNYGTSVAAYVIKKISGKTFYEFQKQNIFVPSGMQQVAGHPLLKDQDNILINKAKGYVYEQEQWAEAPWIYVSKYPAGGANGTVLDLARFAMALTPKDGQSGSLFDDTDMLEGMFSQSYAPKDDFLGISHGFWEYDGQVRSLAHGGTTAGFSSFFSVSPKERIGLAVLVNVADETELLYGLHKLIFGDVIDQPVVKNEFTKNAFDVEGMYLPSRSAYTNFLKIFSYLSAYKIEAINEREISFHMPGYEARYVQVSPYQYRIYESSSPMLTYMYTDLFFEENEGIITRVSSGSSVDMVKMTTFKSLWWFNFSVIGFISAALISIVSLIIFFIRKDKKGLWISIITLAFVLNNLALIFTGINQLYFNPSGLQFFIAGNWLLAGICLAYVTYYAGLLYKKKIDSSMLLSLHRQLIVPMFFLILLIILLIDWNFFSFL